MRDLLILAPLIAFTLWALKAPWIGAMGWTLVSLMSPHTEFGYASAAWPVATGFAVATLIGTLVTSERQNPLWGAAPKWLLAFTVWICITLPSSMLFDASLPLWERSIKIYLMVFVTLALLDTRYKLTAFIWVNVVAVAYFGVKGGVFTLMTGGNYRVWGPGGFIEGNNEVALAVLTVLPMIRYLQMQMTNRWAIYAATGAMLLCVATVVGTHSRGALVGIVCMGAMLYLKTDRKMIMGVFIVLIVMVGLPLMPESWWERMNTIKTYEEDDSALGRINAWGMAFNLAKDRLLGGGFMIWTRPVFLIYGPDPNRAHAAHSIYFQVLGEHGFVGLVLFLGIGAATWWAANDLIRIGRNPEYKWSADLGAMVQVSMVAYAAAGAFLSLAYYDLPYNMMIIVVIAQRLVRMQLGGAKAGPAVRGAGVAAPPPPADAGRGPTAAPRGD